MRLTIKQIKGRDTIIRHAVESESHTTFPAEIAAAQAIIESGYLTSAPGNNCFGIKDWVGSAGRQLLRCTEWFTDRELTIFLLKGDGRTAVLKDPLTGYNSQNRREYAVKDWFATFPSLTACFDCHGRMLQRGWYRSAWVRYTTNHNLTQLIEGISVYYATSSAYAGQLKAMVASHELSEGVVQYRSQLASQTT